MNCKHFGECNGCLITKDYNSQLNDKIEQESQRFKDIYNGDYYIAESPEKHYRSRAEFRIFHFKEQVFYAMRGVNGSLLPLSECQMLISPIQQIFEPMRIELSNSQILKRKLFGIEFLANLNQNIIVTLIYHRKLDEVWRSSAENLSKTLNISIVGRSKGNREIIGSETILQDIYINNEKYILESEEGNFSQPNPIVNEKMINWVVNNSSGGNYLTELYCGAGNFTIPLSKKFNRVIATEVTKSSITLAIKNSENNNISNIKFVRVSSSEFTSAINRERDFFRFKDINLDNISFDSIFVDPPRAGIDSETIKLLFKYNEIIYISCNPETLKRDLDILKSSYKIIKMAIFDQFPYTHHIEIGAILHKLQ